MHSPTRTLPWAIALSGALLGGCLGGQTGGEITRESPDEPNPPERPPTFPGEAGCRDHFENIALADASRLGFSGADVLASALGTHRSTLTWNDKPSVVSFGPEHGASSVELTIEYHDGNVRFVTSDFVPSSSGGPEPALGCSPDRLEVDVLVRLHTAGGALAEEFGASLVATMPNRATLSRELALDSLSGSFFVQTPASYHARALAVTADLDSNGFKGTLAGSVEQRVGTGPDGAVSNLFVTYASWP